MNNTFLEKIKKMIAKHIEEPLDKIQQKILEYLSKHADIFLAAALIKLLVRQQKRSYHKKEIRKKLEKHRSKSHDDPEQQKEEQLMQEVEIENNKLTAKQYTKIKEDIRQCIKSNNTNKLELYIKKLGIKFVQDTGALHFAAKHGKIPALKMMLEYGADVNARDSNRETPLHHAAKFGNLKAVDFLITKGKAKVNLRDVQGRTPLDALEMSPYAETSAGDKMRNLMERWGAKRNVTRMDYLEKQAAKAKEGQLVTKSYDNPIDTASLFANKNKEFSLEALSGHGINPVATINSEVRPSENPTIPHTKQAPSQEAKALSGGVQSKTNNQKVAANQIKIKSGAEEINKTQVTASPATPSLWSRLGFSANKSNAEQKNKVDNTKVSIGLRDVGRGLKDATKVRIGGAEVLSPNIPSQSNQLPALADLGLEQQVQR